MLAVIQRNALSGRDIIVDWESQSDEALLAAVATEPDAMGPLYDRHSRLVYGLARAILQNDTEAQDLTQEVFMSLCEEHGYDRSRGTVGAFLTTVTRTRAIDRVRGRTRRVRLLHDWWQETPTAPSVTPHDRLSEEQYSARVRAALGELSDNERRVIEMAYFQGLTQTEIAEDLGAPLGTVKSWCRRGLLTLKQSLGDLVE